MYSLRSVDVNEMWGPHDTIERLQYKGKDLDFGYSWKCRDRDDYMKVEWIINQLNRKKVSLKGLSKSLTSLGKSWLCVKNRYEIKLELKRLKGEEDPYKIDEIKRNIEIIKQNHIYEKKEKKFKDLKNKISPYTLSLLTGHSRGGNKQRITKTTIRIYNKIKQYYCWNDPRLDDFIVMN